MEEKIISFILNPEFTGIIGFVRIVFLVFGFYCLAWIVFLLLRSSWLRHLILVDLAEFLTYKPFGKRKVLRQWEKIESKLESGREPEYKIAIIEADSFLDGVLERMGYQGEGIGEKIKKLSPDILPNIKDVEQAHQVRNNIVHDPDYRLNLEKAKKTLDTYETALRHLEVF